MLCGQQKKPKPEFKSAFCLFKMSTRQGRRYQHIENFTEEERQQVETMSSADYQTQEEWSETSQTVLANMEYEPVQTDREDYQVQEEWSAPSQTALVNMENETQTGRNEEINSSDRRVSQDQEVTHQVSSSHSGSTLDRMLQVMLERERMQEEREQQRKEEERRRKEEQQLQEKRRLEEERQQRLQDNKRWEELLKTVMTSTSRMSVTPSTSNTLDKLRDVPKLPKLQESDDIEAYLYTFERHMETYKVEKTYWVAQLAPLLRGMAQKAYISVPRESSNDYQEVKEAILRRYDIGEDTYRQRFSEAVPQDKESYSQFSARVGDLLDKWAKHCQTGKDWRELVGTERVLSAMPNSVQAWVRDKKPKNLVEAGKLADDYMRNRKLEYGAGSRQFKRNIDRPGGRDRDQAPREKRDDKSTSGGGVSRENGSSHSSSHSSSHNRKFSKNFDKEKGPLCFLARSGGTYLRSVQTKLRMLITVVSGRKKGTLEEQ